MKKILLGIAFMIISQGQLVAQELIIKNATLREILGKKRKLTVRLTLENNSNDTLTFIRPKYSQFVSTFKSDINDLYGLHHEETDYFGLTGAPFTLAISYKPKRSSVSPCEPPLTIDLASDISYKRLLSPFGLIIVLPEEKIDLGDIDFYFESEAFCDFETTTGFKDFDYDVSIAYNPVFETNFIDDNTKEKLELYLKKLGEVTEEMRLLSNQLRIEEKTTNFTREEQRFADFKTYEKRVLSEISKVHLKTNTAIIKSYW